MALVLRTTFNDIGLHAHVCCPTSFDVAICSLTGNFVINGKTDIGHRQVYLKVELEYDGFYGRMAIENKRGLVRSLFTHPRRASTTMNYDDTNFNNSLCRTFMHFYYVIRYYWKFNYYAIGRYTCRDFIYSFI